VPEILEAGRRQLGVAHGVLDVAVPKISLQRTGIDTVIGQLEAAGVSQHVRMHRETEIGGNAKPRDHLTKSRGRERCTALRREDKGRCRILLAFEPAQGAQLTAGLGFTFICGKTRAGKFQIKRKTRRDRMRAKLKMVQEEMRRRMHQTIPVQGKWLGQVVTGYFNYHAVPTNLRALVAFRSEIARRWRRVLTRRSERMKLNWKEMNRLLDDWLPKPRILHPWPDRRFAVRYPR
jgi:hypothetical protein